MQDKGNIMITNSPGGEESYKLKSDLILMKK